MNVVIHNLFPIPVVQLRYDGITNKDLDTVKLYSDQVNINTGNRVTKETYVLDKSFPELRQFIDDAVRQYSENIICPNDSVLFKITQSWLNYTSPGGSHHKHKHMNSIISGVFYFSAGNMDRIYFNNEVLSSRDIAIPPVKPNLYNSMNWWLPVKTGDLLLFPSHLRHYVAPVEGNSERISLAFNVFASGDFGDQTSLTALTV